MFKMSTCGVALLLAGLGACSGSGLKGGGSTAGAGAAVKGSGLKGGGSTAGAGAAVKGGQAGSTIGSGTTGGTGGMVGAGGGMMSGTLGGTVSCLPAQCSIPMHACAGEVQPNPNDPCGCPICVLNPADAGATKDAGAGGAMAVGGVTATAGVLAAGGVPGGGGTSGVGGSVSTSDLDTCSSDADCTTSCVWTTAPTDSSQCFAQYCCGSNWMSEKRCEANQAAWAVYCPNQSATRIDCPCLTMCDTPAQTITFGCIGGKCEVVCTPPLGGAGGRTVIRLGSGGYSGNNGTGGNGGTGGSSNSGGSGGGGTGGSIASGGVPAAGGAIGAGGVVETGGGMGTGGIVSTGGSGVPCTQITNPTTCDAQVGCYALFSGELPCNSSFCSNHFVSCVNAPPECAPATQPCTIDCPLTVSFCPTGYVSVFSNSSGCCSNGCVAANKCK